MSDPLAALKAATGKSLTETTSDLPNIPSVPATAKASEANFLTSVKAWLEKAAGSAGFVSRKDLANYGVIQQNPDGTYGFGNVKNMAVPPAPTNVIASGAMTTILLEWDNPNLAYGNHGYAEIWASETDSLTLASLIGESSGFNFAHSVGTGATRYYWVRFVSTSNVTGPYQGVAGALGKTSQDPAWLLSVLNDQITEDQLYTDLNKRIDLIDTLGPVDMPKGIIDKIRLQQTDFSQLNTDVDTIGEKLLAAALKIQDNTDLLYDAGVTVTPGTGEVYIYAVREAENRLNDAVIRLNAAESSISLKASSTYVDEQIALAALDPSQIADLSGVNARLAAAEIDIDGLDAAVSLKASLLTVNSQGVRLSTAETEIDALQGEIVSKVSNTTFNNAEARLSTAEQNISAIDGASIKTTVQDIRSINEKSKLDAEALLRSILIGDFTLEESRTSVAIARSELTAKINDDLSAEAAARLQLAAVVNNNVAAISSEQVARANADSALATSINALSATVGGNTAAIASEATTRANAVSSVASQVSTLQTTVGNHTTSIQTSADSIDGIRASYTVKIDNNGVMGGYGLTSVLAEGGAAISKFIASVDQFAIVAPNRTPGQLNSVPFAVLTTAQTINGVSFQPGVYIDGASINAGSIGNAQIGSLAADKITAGQLSAARINVGELVADSTFTNNLNVKGQVNVGNYNGWGWPAAGLGGAHLSANGFLIGNYNNGGKYFQIDSGYGTGGNATIHTNIPAYIEDAQISTLKVAGHNITTTGYGEWSPGQVIGNGGGIQPQWVSSPVYLNFTVAPQSVVIIATLLTANTGDDSTNAYLHIGQDGVWQVFRFFSSSIWASESNVTTTVLYPSAGSHYFQIGLGNDYNGGWIPAHVSITILATLR